MSTKHEPELQLGQRTRAQKQAKASKAAVAAAIQGPFFPPPPEVLQLAPFTQCKSCLSRHQYILRTSPAPLHRNLRLGAVLQKRGEAQLSPGPVRQPRRSTRRNYDSQSTWAYAPQSQPAAALPSQRPPRGHAPPWHAAPSQQRQTRLTAAKTVAHDKRKIPPQVPYASHTVLGGGGVSGRQPWGSSTPTAVPQARPFLEIPRRTAARAGGSCRKVLPLTPH